MAERSMAMTAKQFDKAMGTLSGYGIIDRILIAAIAICLIAPAPFAFVNYNIMCVFWVIFAMLFMSWEYINIMFTPAYPVFQKTKDIEANYLLSENQRTVNSAALFPADRTTAVRAFQNKRLLISLMIVIGLIAQGTALINSDKIINSTPLIVGTSLTTIVYNIGSILFAVKKGIHSVVTRQMCMVLMISFAITSLSMTRYEPDDSGLGTGTVMLINAAITLIISLISYKKCLHDAKNTARNGEKI
ncbi:MAG: hypothetical protein MSJ26_10480 [Oscillospiraceae bacterium]|nr:hypothetical protein [Oscillospiraceae bacterium]